MSFSLLHSFFFIVGSGLYACEFEVCSEPNQKKTRTSIGFVYTIIGQIGMSMRCRGGYRGGSGGSDEPPKIISTMGPVDFSVISKCAVSEV